MRKSSKFSAKQFAKVNQILEKIDYKSMMKMYNKPAKIVLLFEFLNGIWRGIVLGIGFTIVGGLLLFLLQDLLRLQIPIVSHFVVEMMRVVERRLRSY